MSKFFLTGLLSLAIVAGTLLIGSAASLILPDTGTAAESEAESESEWETESEWESGSEQESETAAEAESEPESETEGEFLQAPDLTLTGTVIGGGSGMITIQTEDGKQYTVSFVDALTDFSDSGLNDGMKVTCTLKDKNSDADGIFYADQIRTVQVWN